MSAHPPSRDESLLRTHEVAALLRVHPKHVYRLLRRGLPGRRVGSEWRFSRSEVLDWAGADVGHEEHAAGAATVAPVAGQSGTTPSLLASNGDIVIEILLRLANERGGPLIGYVHGDR